ncbi:hypothetical protein MKX03_020138 [Papaver bracteatum]|nr:hypothetical protein MKX03_020138 [Papaver bracteatum]
MCLLVFISLHLVTITLAVSSSSRNSTTPTTTTSAPKTKTKPLSKSSPPPPPQRPRSKPQTRPEDLLSFTHYEKRCPDVEGIIQRKVAAWIKKDPTIAASLIRLHFHDCAVRGCDASILLNHKGSERSANVSLTLRGFDVIDDVKAELERKCPKIVSCADILTAAARDATVDVGGPFWAIPFGRKDGSISIAKEANIVPMGRESVSDLLHFYETRGLNVLDLVILSGAHTIGRTSCSPVLERLHNFNKTGRPDPSLDSKYLMDLRRKCKKSTNFVDLDVTTPRKFDQAYYTNLQQKKGLLLTDQLLHSDPRTAPIVEAFATQPTIFDPQFAASMVRLGNIHVLAGKNQGQIRFKCGYVNH